MLHSVLALQTSRSQRGHSHIAYGVVCNQLRTTEVQFLILSSYELSIELNVLSFPL